MGREDEGSDLWEWKTPRGLFLEIAHSNPQQSPHIGDGGMRLVSLSQATTSVPEGAIGIPLLFLCHYCR